MYASFSQTARKTLVKAARRNDVAATNRRIHREGMLHGSGWIRCQIILKIEKVCDSEVLVTACCGELLRISTLRLTILNNSQL